MKVKILSTNPLMVQTFPITEDMITLPLEDEQAYFSGRPIKWENGHIVIDEEAEKSTEYIEIKKEQLRKQREVECFNYVNRGSLWYVKLSEKQVEELEKWYEAWLNVTETLEAPTKPEWLK